MSLRLGRNAFGTAGADSHGTGRDTRTCGSTWGTAVLESTRPAPPGQEESMPPSGALTSALPMTHDRSLRTAQAGGRRAAERPHRNEIAEVAPDVKSHPIPRDKRRQPDPGTCWRKGLFRSHGPEAIRAYGSPRLIHRLEDASIRRCQVQLTDRSCFGAREHRATPRGEGSGLEVNQEWARTGTLRPTSGPALVRSTCGPLICDIPRRHAGYLPMLSSRL